MSGVLQSEVYALIAGDDLVLDVAETQEEAQVRLAEHAARLRLSKKISETHYRAEGLNRHLRIVPMPLSELLRKMIFTSHEKVIRYFW